MSNMSEVMSKNKQILVVQPPMFLDVMRKESFKIPGCRCTLCHGSGYVMEDGPEGLCKAECRVCGGSGKLTADIVIEWKAETEESVVSNIR